MAAPEKVAAVEEITNRFRESDASVVTEYRGLSVAKLTQLRRDLGSDANFRVAKNTLVKRAAAEAGVQGLDDLLARPHHQHVPGDDVGGRHPLLGTVPHDGDLRGVEQLQPVQLPLGPHLLHRPDDGVDQAEPDAGQGVAVAAQHQQDQARDHEHPQQGQLVSDG